MKILELCCVLAFVYLEVNAQTYNTIRDERLFKCPQHWVKFQNSCYRFVKSPLRSRNEAKRNCQANDADLVSISSIEEHSFLMYQLIWKDPQHRKWYIGARQQSPNYWVNDADGTSLSEMEAAFLPSSEYTEPRDYLVYSFSYHLKRWGFERVTGEDPYLFICEAPIIRLQHLLSDDRDFQYGIEYTDPERIPRGPYFIKQPKNIVYDESRRDNYRDQEDVTLSCLAGGHPTPTYEWFKEDWENERLVAKKIEPLNDSRYTISGGSLIINRPNQNRPGQQKGGDRGTYHCKATNIFGSIISESVTLTFGFISDFNQKRPPESGKQNWGKAINCDPPPHYPEVNYYWSREYFPNLVEEDKRVFVSYDGALYFSALENIDAGNYSCNVQLSDEQVSSNGRNGPFFPLKVNSNSNYQQLNFPNNFPKSFPEAPVAGKDVRLECIAFGYPVPSYNWTRKGSTLPRSAISTNYNRVLIIPKIQVEDQGEYVCRAYNDRASIQHSVILSIQAAPNFTVPLEDRHMDNKADLTWSCEAFGIPDVTYSWLRNGEPLVPERLPQEDRDRYVIQDNVLTIRYLDPERDQAMYQCKAHNVLQTRYSSAQLRVLSLRPDFRKHPLEPETYAGEGSNVTIVCNPEAAPKPKFTWKKDNAVLGSGGRRTILENGNLIISPVSRDDDGIYTCIAQNMYGTDESSGRLIVLRGPNLVEEMPQRIVSVYGRNLGLQCRAWSEEILDLAYSWTHNGIPLEPDNVHVISHGGFLRLINVTYQDAGEYECAVSSAVGRVSTQTKVVVEGPPGPAGGVQVLEITKNSAVLQWTDGSSNGRTIDRYIISGRTNWNTTWFNISEDVYGREVDRYNRRKEAAIENVLVPYSSYEFRVQGVNNLGVGIASAPSPRYNTLSDKPYKAPANVGGGGGKVGDLVITWTPFTAKDQNGPGLYYKVFWRKHKETLSQLGAKEAQFHSMIVRDNTGVAIASTNYNDYYTKFDVKVQAANQEGFGPESKIVTIFSAEDMPQVSPQQVSARSFNSTAVNVSWIPITPTRQNIRGKLIGHRLKYWRKDNREEDAVYFLSRNTSSWSLIVGLQPDTYYYVKVMAYNSAGEGPESERFLEKTYRKAPQKPPSSVNVYGVDPTTVRVVWRYVQPSLDEEPLIGYKVRVWERDQDISQANDTIILVGNKLEAYVTNLSPGKTYKMRVLAFSNGGDGRMSSPALTFQMGDEDEFRSNQQPRLTSLPILLSLPFLLLCYYV